MDQLLKTRRFPVGAEILTDRSGIHFRVWAPDHENVELVFTVELPSASVSEKLPSSVPMQKDASGYFSTLLPFISKGLLYGFKLDDSGYYYPDPASRFQPHGVSGLSKIIDCLDYKWNDSDWKGIPKDNRVLYEMHAGTFTPEGTWEAARKQLHELASLGITIIELLPVAEFEGRFNWGYDGIFQFAPSHRYGTPDDLRSFIDQAHQCGIGVILDVVYNHLGSGSSFFKKFSPYYFTDRYKNEWGAAINFDGPESGPVREYFLSNAEYWVREYHFDGFRIDATQQIFDASEKNIIKEIVLRVRAQAGEKTVFTIAENECQDTTLFHQYGIDAVWSDDFHRSATVALTGHAEAYYSDYRASPQEFISTAKYGYLYQGQYYTWQKKIRGTPALDLPVDYFIHYLQNHDQIANSLRGLRMHEICDPSLYRAFTLLLLLGPQIPLLFQGQEFCSSSPFYFFTDKDEARTVRAARGRKIFLSQFPSIAAVSGPLVPHPGDIEAFQKCKLNFEERFSNQPSFLYHKHLLSIRRSEMVFRAEERKGIDGEVVGENAFLLRYFGKVSSQDRLLIVNLGSDLRLDPNPHPLSAPPRGCEWKVIISSEDPAYGGNSTFPLKMDGIVAIPGHAAFFVGSGKVN
jgi:maltooligosyltrehalose trehalohydrolase